MPSLDARLELANRIARQSADITLKYFLTDRFDVESKPDGSPLTIADRQTEQFLRDQIAAQFPEDGIVGEEFGITIGKNSIRWILDPIDGTKSFIRGVPLFGTMVGIEVDGQAVIGSLYFPGLREGIYACRGRGAWHFQGDQEPVRARVSNRKALSESVLVTSEVEGFAARNADRVYSELARSVYFCRTWGDAYGYLLVATGRVEIMIDAILSVWDAAAVQPIIEEAGGRFTDWQGQPRIDGGDAIGTNGHVHDSVLALIEQSGLPRHPID